MYFMYGDKEVDELNGFVRDASKQGNCRQDL